MAVGVTIGHPCTACGATMAACDEVIKAEGRGCCVLCFQGDTHGLLDKFRVIDVADHQQEIDNLHRLMAQMVLARSEHANAIRSLRADLAGLLEEVSLLRGDQARVDEREKRRLMTEVMTETRLIVARLPERIRTVEQCIEGIEAKLKLRRKPPPPPPPPGGTT